MAVTEQQALKPRRQVRLPEPLTSGPLRVAAVLALSIGAGLVALLVLDRVTQLSTNGRELILTVSAGLGLPLLYLRLRALAIAVGALVAVWLLGAFLFTWAPDHVYIASPVDEAVGASAYFGTPYLPGQYASVVIQLLVIAAGLAGVYLARRRGAMAAEPAAIERADPDVEPLPWYRGARMRAALLVVAGLVVTLTVYPNVYDGALTAASSSPPDAWDQQNFLTWQWLIADTGAVPMKDFFWPYGTTWVFSDFPLGGLWGWMSYLPVMLLCGWGLWRLAPAEGRAARVALCLLALPVMNLWEGHLFRYAVPFAVVVAYAGVGPGRHRSLTWGHAVVAAGLLFCGLYQADLIIGVVIGMGMLLAAEFVAGTTPRDARRLARAVLIDALPFAVLVVVPVSWLVLGGFDGYFRFYTELRATSAFGAFDTHYGALSQYIGARPSAAMFRVMAPALTGVAGFALIAFGDRRTAGPARLLLAGSALGFFLVLKHIVRDLGDATLDFTVVASLWSAALLWTSRRPIVALLIGAYVATAFFTFNRLGAVDLWWNGYTRDAPRRVTESFDLIGKGDQIETQRNRLFDRQRFPTYVRTQQQAAALQKAMRGSSRRTFFVLGDEPILYAWFKQRPPFQIQLYDASRRSEQKVMVDRIEEEDAQFALWRFDFGQDAIPQYVRDPIVFRYAVDNYVPVTLTPAGDVLRKRAGSRPIDGDYWTARLGTVAALGYVPASSTAEDADRCSGGKGCNPYVILKGDPRHRVVSSFRISGHGRTFTVAVATRPGTKEYPVRLDHLWFWSLVGRAATVRAVRPGWTAERVNLKTDDALW